MTLLQRLCPHPFGWSYNPTRHVRFCRLCAQRQESHAYSADTHAASRTALLQGDTLTAQRIILAASKQYDNVD